LLLYGHKEDYNVSELKMKRFVIVIAAALLTFVAFLNFWRGLEFVIRPQQVASFQYPLTVTLGLADPNEIQQAKARQKVLVPRVRLCGIFLMTVAWLGLGGGVTLFLNKAPRFVAAIGWLQLPVEMVSSWAMEGRIVPIAPLNVFCIFVGILAVYASGCPLRSLTGQSRAA
jgi:hypothetical protein